jgi:hypothetical protein
MFMCISLVSSISYITFHALYSMRKLFADTWVMTVEANMLVQYGWIASVHEYRIRQTPLSKLTSSFQYLQESPMHRVECPGPSIILGG